MAQAVCSVGEQPRFEATKDKGYCTDIEMHAPPFTLQKPQRQSSDFLVDTAPQRWQDEKPTWERNDTFISQPDTEIPELLTLGI